MAWPWRAANTSSQQHETRLTRLPTPQLLLSLHRAPVIQPTNHNRGATKASSIHHCMHGYHALRPSLWPGPAEACVVFSFEYVRDMRRHIDYLIESVIRQWAHSKGCSQCRPCPTSTAGRDACRSTDGYTPRLAGAYDVAWSIDRNPSGYLVDDLRHPPTTRVSCPWSCPHLHPARPSRIRPNAAA